MKLYAITPHLMLEQFVEWNRIGGVEQAKLVYPNCVPFFRLIHTGDEGRRQVGLEGWYNDSHAIYTNKLLAKLKDYNDLMFKVVMNYYFGGQRQDLTGERFNMSATKAGGIINSALTYIDGVMEEQVA